MNYPQDFPAESRARVEATRIRAGRQFDFNKAKAKWRSDIEAFFWTYVLKPFVVFAGESSRLGLWPVDKMDRNCREFLRLLTIDAYYQKGKAAGLRDMISNWNGSILWEVQQEVEKTSQWRKYENICLKFAVKGKPTTQSTGIIPGPFAGLTAGEREKLGLSRNPTEVSGNRYFPDVRSEANPPRASFDQNENTRNAISKKRARITEIERTLNRPPITEYRGQSTHGGANSRLRLEEERQHLLIAVAELEKELERTTAPRAQNDASSVHVATEKRERLKATVNSPIAARRMETYLKSNGIGQTDFAATVGTTDRTLRSFRRTGKVRRDIFESIATHMGTTKEALIRE